MMLSFAPLLRTVVAGVLFILALQMLGCASVSWVDASKLRSDDALTELTQKYPDAHGAVLLREDTFENFPGREMIVTKHEALRFFTEASLAYGRVEIHLPEGSELVTFAARTITRDGKEVPFDNSQLMRQGSRFVNGAGNQVEVTKVIAKFPRLQVGGALEYTYVVKHEGGWGNFSHTVNGPFPIVDYKLTLSTSSKVGYQFRVYNNDAPLKTTKGAMRHTYTMHHKNIAPQKSEPYSPDASLREVWLRFKLSDSRYSPWVNALWWPGKLLLQDENDLRASGQRLKLDDDVRARCQKTQTPQTCLLQSHLKAIDDDIAYTGFGHWSSMSSVAKTVQRKRGTGADRNLVLFDALQNEGIDASWVLTTRKYSKAVDYKFAASGWFNHVLLRVSVDDNTYFVDAGCGHCALGVLPRDVAGQRGILMRKNLMSAAPASGEWVDLDAIATPQPRLTDDIAVDVDDQGTATYKLTRTHESDLARERQRERLRADADDERRRAERIARNVIADATDVKTTQQECNSRRGVCKQVLTFRVVGYGDVHDDRMSLPVDRFTERWRPSTSALDAKERMGAVFFDTDVQMVQTLRLSLPTTSTFNEDDRDKKGGRDHLSYVCTMTAAENVLQARRQLDLKAGAYDDATRKAMAQTLYDYDGCLPGITDVKVGAK